MNRILFIVSRKIWPINAGGPARTLSLLRYLREQGFHIDLVSTDFGQEYARHMKPYCDNYWPLKGSSSETAPSSAPSALDGHLSFLKRMRYPELDAYAEIVAARTKPLVAVSDYVHCSRALDKLPMQTLKVIDTHDVQYVRAPNARKAGGNLDNRHCTRSEETAELNRAHLLLAIQNAEGSLLREMCPDKDILVISHGCSIKSSRVGSVDPYKILFVGSLYDPNVLGITSFLDEVWADVCRALPSIKLTICGSVCDAINKSKYRKLECLGIVDDLEPHYREAAIVITPIPYGTGLKIKTAEAIAYGKCLISTEAGVYGLEDPPCVVEPVKKMGSHILHILANPSVRKSWENKAEQYAARFFSPHRAFGPLVAYIKDFKIKLLNGRIGREQQPP